MFTINAYYTCSTNNYTLLTILTVSTLLTILTITVLLTVLTIFGMFTILKNEVQNDYDVYEKIQGYNSKRPDTIQIFTRRVN